MDTADPFRMIGIIVKAAEECGIELERALKFMAAVSMRMATPPGTPEVESKKVTKN